MAGSGVKLFVQNTPLTAADLNTYIQDQVICVFDDEAARTAAFGGAGEPTLSEGRFSYLKDTDKLYYYPQGGPWTEVGAQVEDGEITAAKLASDSVTTAKIVNLNVTTAKLADDAVTSAKIADGTIVNADISATAAIGLNKLADATIDIKTANYPLVLTDKNKFIKMNSSSNRTITVPLQATANFPEGSQIHIIRYGSGTLEIVGESGAVIIYATPGKFLRAQYSSATLLKCADTNVWMLMGDLSAS
jgi:hypothetical protein